MAQERAKLDNQLIGLKVQELQDRKTQLMAIHQNNALLAVRNAQEAYRVAKDSEDAGNQSGAEASRLGLPTSSEALISLNKAKDELSLVNSVANGTIKSVKDINKAVSSGTISIGAQTDLYLGLVSSIAGLNQQIATYANQQAANVFKGNVQAYQDEAKASKETLKTQVELLNNDKKDLENRLKTRQVSEDVYILESANIDKQIVAKEYLSKTEETLAEYKALQLVRESKFASEASKRAALERQTVLSAELIASAQSLRLKNEEIEVKKNEELKKLSNDRFSAQMGLLEAQQSARDLETETGFAARESTSAMYERLGLSKEFLLNAQAELELDKLKAEEESKLITLSLKYAQDYASAMQITDETVKNARLASLQTVFDAEVANITKISALKQGDVKAELKFNLDTSAIESLKSVFDELSTSLEGLGLKGTEAFSGMIGAIGELTTSQETYKKSIEELDNKAFEASQDPKRVDEYNEALKAGNDLRKKSQKDELAGTAKILGASKKLFKEKTAAYKILNAAEKAAHIAKIAMDMKELYTKLFVTKAKVGAAVAGEAAETATTQAGFLARAGTYIKEIYAKFTKMLGPWGMAAAAAVIAAIGLGGGSKGGGSFVPNAEQRQETQGTAMGWDSEGNKVQVRRGVFGDTDAKSESIANSLEIIKDNSVDGLSYDNRVVNLLSSIDSGINKTAKGLYGISGLRTGSMFGTIEGGSSGGGLLGTGIFGSKTSRSISDSGLLIEGTFADLAKDTNKAVIDFFEQVTVNKKSWYGKKRSWVETNRTEINDATSEFFQDIFGNATELFIQLGTQSGISVTAINDVLSNLNITEAAVSLRGLKGAELQEELSSVIGAILDDASFAIFESFEKYADFGEGMLETVVRVTGANKKVTQQLKNMGIEYESTLASIGVTPEYEEKVSYFMKDLASATEEDLIKALETLGMKIPEYLTQASKDATLQQFQNLEIVVPEDALSQLTSKAVTSAVNSLTNLTQSDIDKLGAAGISFVEKTVEVLSDGISTSFSEKDLKSVSYDISEALIELAGGIENFLDQSEFFRDNFLTDEEKLVPTQSAISKEMSRLGLASVDTREEFKLLVSSLDLTTERGRENYQILMDIADGFDKVASAAENLKDSTRDYEIQILRLTGKTKEATALERSAALEDVDPSLRATQEYVWALEDLQDAEKDLEKARQEQIKTLEKAVTSTKNFVDTIKKLKDSLLLDSSLSTLTPLQKYETAKDRAVEVYTRAMSTGTSEAEIQDRESARKELGGAVTDFLKLSREVYASSDRYTEDFNLIQNILSTAGVGLEEQLTVEEQTLGAIETVNASVLSVETAIQNLTTAQNNVNTTLQGYLSEKLNNSYKYATATDYVSNYGAAILQDGNIQVKSGEVLDLQTARTYLQDSLAIVEAGLVSKKDWQQDLINTFGADTSILAYAAGVSQQQVKDYFAETGIQQFAVGTNYVPEDMPAIVHKGERIIPAADNAELIGAISNKQQTDTEILIEIRRLNEKISQLEQTIQVGDMMNIEATNRNTQEVSRTVKDAGSAASHSEAVRRRTAIV
jgi:hypothetical protein